ncbi:MAG TPA: DNA mismatch repair endonuclease MutL [Spirochaetia bacterium]|nr:DNA mismatch repair endonuclease MutL [Spirochaetia bacterium]
MGIIKVLPPPVARLIAAGEVIDRPASALRELLDNAIDSGAREIAVRIEEGGIGLIRLSDDGSGMDAEDLALSILPHATSKISSADDLLRARSLGFRGEALASIAAAARVEILSRDAASPSAQRLVAGPGSAASISACAGRKGTTVTVSGLFADFPARRQFLKRPQAEAALCRQVLVDKALAHPGIRFSFESGSAKPEILLPAERPGRVADCLREPPRELLHAIRFSGPGFEGEIVLAGPSFYRPDRRLMQAFVNRRRVQEWPLLQALEYGFEGFLPGGAHPCALLFLEIDPALADFNIHPAKREVRFKDPDAPRRAVSQALRDFLGELARRDPAQVGPEPGPFEGPELAGLGGPWSASGLGADGPAAPGFPPSRAGRWQGGVGAFGAAEGSGGYAGRIPAESWPSIDALRDRVAAPPSPGPALGFRYLGQALGPFLLFELGDSLFLLDQHAAHERILFDRLARRPPEAQELLVPEPVGAESDAEEARIEALAPGLALLGFRLERSGGELMVAAAPALLPQGAARELRELARSGAEDPLRAIRATMACRAAVKDGDELEPEAARELIAAALELPEPRCPHGRPIWVRLTREELYRMVRRIV